LAHPVYELDLPRYSEDAICISKMNFLGQDFQRLECHRQTDRQTDTTKHIIMPHSRPVNAKVWFSTFYVIRSETDRAYYAATTTA